MWWYCSYSPKTISEMSRELQEGFGNEIPLLKLIYDEWLTHTLYLVCMHAYSSTRVNDNKPV